MCVCVYMYMCVCVCVYVYVYFMGFPSGASGKEPDCQCRRRRNVILISVLGRSLGGEHGNPLQYPCLENPMDRGAWRAMVYRITTCWTQLKGLSMHACISYFIAVCFIIHLLLFY